jgi:hypothetical protein
VWSSGGFSSYTQIGWYNNTHEAGIGIGWYKFCWISGVNGPNNNGGVTPSGQSGDLFYWSVENNSPDSSNILVSCMS